jgi:RNA-directed DNA polymerase
MEEVCEPRNAGEALKRVEGNRGGPGTDGMTVEELAGHLEKHWPRLRQELLAGTYRPQPVKRVEIPKPQGGVRKLGIPTVVDRFIQQAVLQVLQKRWDRTFSEHSYGFRPGRSAHQAVEQAQEYIAQGYGWVVDIDIEKFFDRVNHDKLMGQVAKRVEDKRLLKLIRAYLNAGVMEDGLVSPTREGTPQGGPLSPLLSNIVLDGLDRELERRRHRFVRYADDCNIYVRSERAGQRVKEGLTKFLWKKLRLKVNESKSAVDRPSRRKFLGYSYTKSRGPKRRIAPESLKRCKARVRELTRRTRGKSLPKVVEELSRYLRGWWGYYGHSETPSVAKHLDEWIRRRLRRYAWTQWETGRNRVAELVRRGADRTQAKKVVWEQCGPWPASGRLALHEAFPVTYFAALGLPSLGARARSTRRTAVYGPVRTVV